MFALIEIKDTDTKVELYKEIIDAEEQMKIRYHKLIQKAKALSGTAKTPTTKVKQIRLRRFSNAACSSGSTLSW